MKKVLERYLLASVAMIGVCAINVGSSWATSVMVVPGGTGGDGCCACTVTDTSPNCVAADCASLGYTQSPLGECKDKKFVRCPFDTSKVFCPSTSTTTGGDTTECAANTYPMMEYVSDTLGVKTVYGYYMWSMNLSAHDFPGTGPSASDAKWHYSTNSGASIVISCTDEYQWNGLGSTNKSCPSDSYGLSFTFKCRFKVGSDGTEKDFSASKSLSKQTYNTFYNTGYRTEDFCKSYVKQQADGCYKFSTSKGMTTGGDQFEVITPSLDMLP